MYYFYTARRRIWTECKTTKGPKDRLCIQARKGIEKLQKLLFFPQILLAFCVKGQKKNPNTY